MMSEPKPFASLSSGLLARKGFKRSAGFGLLAGKGDEVFAFPPASGEAHEPALLPWLERVRDALRDRRQIAPSFDDGVAVAEVMDQLKTTLIRV